MGNYRNFKLTAYFIAHATAKEEAAHLQTELDFFKKYMRLDKIYLEPFRSGIFASEQQVLLCRDVLQKNGIEVAGGITTTDETDNAPKHHLFSTFCYNDERQLSKLAEVTTFLGKHFDEFIIDDFYFTTCTCEKCRAGRDAYNAAHGVTDGSWQAYRLDLMRRVSEQYMIAPAKKVNPSCRIIIKFPNWQEGYQEAGYNPAGQRDLFDGVYTGTETRDPGHTDQHLPRYLSFSLMTYFESMCPGRNGGGWFDPFDLQSLDQYLEQAYLTAFSKPKELMLFCFQALVDSPEVAALGYHLDRLDRVLDFAGAPVGVPCYLPVDAQGEDNAQDFLGMNGLPVVCTPYFPENAPALLLTRAAAYDPEIVDKLEAYVAKGGKAMVTNGFAEATMERGLKRMTGVRFHGRRAEVSDYMTERLIPGSQRMSYAHGRRPVQMPVAEFRNNTTWALIKGVDGEENFGMLLRDCYGKGELLTLVLPDTYSRLRALPEPVLTRLRAELPVNGVYLEAVDGVSVFHYDNGAFILYAYVQEGADPSDVLVHIKGDVKALRMPAESTMLFGDFEPETRPEKAELRGPRIEPAYRTKDETVFCVTVRPGDYHLFVPEK